MNPILTSPLPPLRAAIDYITELLDDRAALVQRLQIARGILPLGHPAAQLDPRQRAACGTPPALPSLAPLNNTE